MALARHLSCSLTLEWSSRTRQGLPCLQVGRRARSIEQSQSCLGPTVAP